MHKHKVVKITIGILSVVLLAGCTAEHSNTTSVAVSQSEKSSDKSAAMRDKSWTTTTQGMTLSVVMSEGVMRYQLAVTVPNGCYSEGEVKALNLEKDARFKAKVEYQPGICTQAIKTLSFGGVVKNADINSIAFEVLDQRSGETSLIRLDLN